MLWIPFFPTKKSSPRQKSDVSFAGFCLRKISSCRNVKPWKGYSWNQNSPRSSSNRRLTVPNTPETWTHARWQPPSDYLFLQGSEICRPTSETVVRPRKEDQSPFAANIYKQKDHRWSTRNGIKAYDSEPAECCLCIQMRFVRFKLYRLHVLSPPSACRGTQTFRYWQAFLVKTQLKRKNLSTNFKVL